MPGDMKHGVPAPIQAQSLALQVFAQRGAHKPDKLMFRGGRNLASAGMFLSNGVILDKTTSPTLSEPTAGL